MPTDQNRSLARISNKVNYLTDSKELDTSKSLCFDLWPLVVHGLFCTVPTCHRPSENLNLAFDVSVMLSDDVLYVSLLLASIGWGYVTTHPCWGTGLVIRNTFHMIYVFSRTQKSPVFYVSEYISFSMELKIIFLRFPKDYVRCNTKY